MRLPRLRLSVVVFLSLICVFTLSACEDGAEAIHDEPVIQQPDVVGDVDQDLDGVYDEEDNCPSVANADQSDLDADAIGDACDDDIDGDGVLNESDNCKSVANSGQEDKDQDGRGDACDHELSIRKPIFDVEYKKPIYDVIFITDPSDPSDPGEPQTSLSWKKIVDGEVVSMAVNDSGAPIAVGFDGEILSTSQDVKVAIKSMTGWQTRDVDVKDAVAQFPYFAWDEALFEDFQKFPVSTIAVEGNKVYVGTSGLLLYSEGGSSFEVADIFPIISKSATEAAFHYTCSDGVQFGAQATAVNQFIGVQRVCDIAFDSGRAILAYDNGMIYNDNLDSHIVDPKEHDYNWQGEVNSGHITHDIAKAAGKMIVARDDGVYESSDGASWQQSGLSGQEVFSVHVASDGTLYAGTAEKVYSNASGEWQALGQFDTVRSIESCGDLVVVGTKEGVFTSSDGGANWSDVNYDIASKDVRTVSCDGTKIYAGTWGGLFELEL